MSEIAVNLPERQSWKSEVREPEIELSQERAETCSCTRLSLAGRAPMESGETRNRSQLPTQFSYFSAVGQKQIHFPGGSITLFVKQELHFYYLSKTVVKTKEMMCLKILCKSSCSRQMLSAPPRLRDQATPTQWWLQPKSSSFCACCRSPHHPAPLMHPQGQSWKTPALSTSFHRLLQSTIPPVPAPARLPLHTLTSLKDILQTAIRITFIKHKSRDNRTICTSLWKDARTLWNAHDKCVKLLMVSSAYVSVCIQFLSIPHLLGSTCPNSRFARFSSSFSSFAFYDVLNQVYVY